jgi:hypothetical protein
VSGAVWKFAALAPHDHNRLASTRLPYCGAGACPPKPLQTGSPSDAVDWAALLDGPLPGLVEAGDLDNAWAIVAAALAKVVLLDLSGSQVVHKSH